MNVAVLGGGLQGCCVAIALADRGIKVTLFDRNSRLLERAAVANEGKIHLGYMYAGDPTLNTARTMLRGALAFAPFFERYLGLAGDAFAVSSPTAYVVHRRSQKSAEDVGRYLLAVHSLVQEAADRNGSYFGIDLKAPLRQWSASELEQELNPAEVLAAHASPEVAINPVALADTVRERVEQTPGIELRLRHEALSVDGENQLFVNSRGDDGTMRERFDHVVNALWDGRLALDGTRGLRPIRPWIHRLKYGVLFRPQAHSRMTRSITIVLGPFGEVVSHADQSVYLTWYPCCLTERTSAIAPPHWPIDPAEPLHSEIIRGTYEALAAVLPALRQCGVEALADVVVRGGPIVAWGDTDIDDPRSELHRRFEIGVTSTGCYHSVDPGKLTMAPLFAVECAARISASPC